MTADDQKVIFSMVGVSKTHGQKTVLRDISLGFIYGAKIGVLGLNGAGKSTLLRIMAGTEESSNGEVVRAPGYTVGMLEQEPALEKGKTVLAVVEEGTSVAKGLLADLSDFDPQAGKINFGVLFTVEHDGQSYEVEPTYRGGMGGEPQVTSATVPGTGGIALSPGRIDAEGGTVQLQIYDPLLAPEARSPASLVLHVSTKPFISLVWIGTILIVTGIIMAIFLRRKDIATIPVEG